jgi:uncharacterized DUF497 family protein
LLEFDWDTGNLEHIAEHRVTAAEVEFVSSRPTLDIEYQDWHEGEERYAEAGATRQARFLIVITTWRGIEIRVVIAYEAPGDVVEEYLRTR